MAAKIWRSQLRHVREVAPPFRSKRTDYGAGVYAVVCASIDLVVNILLFSQHPSTAMRSLSVLLGLLALAVSGAYGTALTYKLGANEKACFFTFVERANAKVAYYFAVRAYKEKSPR
jgi:hypothetical protein